MKGKVYIAGPMKGYHEYNFRAFMIADKDLTEQGYETINPAQIDLDDGFDPKTPQESLTGKELEDFIVRDIHMVLSADAIVVLTGWRESKGVAVEVAVAKYSGKPIYMYPTMVEIIE